jgi:adenine phosphoribosyltransferase
MTSIRDLDAFLRERVHDVADFPTPGIVFKDISPLLADRVAFGAAVDAMVGQFGRGTIDTVVGIEARGFILGAAVAYHAAAGFVPIRKAGKLPRSTVSRGYDLEYGAAVIEVHEDAFGPGERVLVVDDVLATGGTAAAAVELVRAAGADLIGVSVLIELRNLGGRDLLPGVDVQALLTY